MSVKLSNSGINTYLECPKKYEIRYKEKIYSNWKSSALYFGNSMDLTLNFVLENFKTKPDKLIKLAINKFDESWEQQEDRNFGTIDMPKYEYVLYSRYDYDPDLLLKEDWKELFSYNKDLNDQRDPETEPEHKSPFDRLNNINAQLKEKEFKDLIGIDRRFYNFCSWLALKRKAHHMIAAYVNKLLPHIEDVLLVQKELSSEDGDGNKLTGIADFVCKLKAGTYGSVTLDKPEIVIPDNKTSSMEYSEDSVSTSQQLTKYKVMLNEEYPEYNITKGAYFVIHKKLVKDTTKTCKECGHVATGAHKTCDAEIDGKRCNGAWDKVVKVDVPVQLVVQEIPERFTEMVMENVDAVVTCISSGVFPRNFNACAGMYGTPCEYFNLCHKNKMDDLKKG